MVYLPTSNIRFGYGGKPIRPRGRFAGLSEVLGILGAGQRVGVAVDNRSALHPEDLFVLGIDTDARLRW